jgi:hypothetical protein
VVVVVIPPVRVVERRVVVTVPEAGAGVATAVVEALG